MSEARRLRDVALAEAARLGFHRAGVATIEPPARYPAYRAWLEADQHGSMAYMAAPEHVAGRLDPGSLLEGARAAVVVALAYAPDDDSRDDRARRGLVARYARGLDYHGVIKHKLRQLAAALEAAAGRPVQSRACVDTAPVLERELAERAGLGFVAKNTMLISPGLGSYTLLGELLVDVELAPTESQDHVTQRCGSCRACLDACPTGAFPAPHVLDARRCISYLTIEHRGSIEPALRPALGPMIFGCDICQQVCPFNAAAPHRVAPAPELTGEPGRGAPDLLGLLALGANQRRRYVEGTAMRRASREQLARNVCVALGNSGDPGAIPALEHALEDRSPLVRAHAAWALGRLGASEACARRLEIEEDPEVREALQGAAERPIDRT
ncbi:MAG TPA: tRNA epoxyqueuosine(34) reductase QueG [Kofleriaceae bacterium]|nr:tRNA epoxyqueuosine(34) reductase QueG [Kofleriaceae bacterium]